MNLRLAGKTALITGGAGGLGSAMARKFIEHGAKVVISDLNFEAAKKVADSLGAIAVHHDVQDESSWQQVYECVKNELGSLNILVNNAGIGGGGTGLEETSLEQWQKTHSVNLDSVFLGSKTMMPLMKDAGMGSIINIASIAGKIASWSMPAYNSSKAAVVHLSKSIALYCARTAPMIRCNSICPVFTNTPILDPMKERFGAQEALTKLARQIPIGKVGEPDDVAYAALYLASDEAKMVTGTEILVDGAISAM